MLKRLSDEFFTLVPERLGSFWIERIPAYTFAYRIDDHVIGNDLANVTVLAISAADLTSGSDDCGPHRGCGPLRNGFQLEGRLTLCRKLLIHLIYHLLNLAHVHVTTQLR